MDNDKYVISIDNFEGPFHILLELIEKRKLFINDISLSAIADDYIKFINDNKIDNSLISSFIIIASTLILIKSKSLLPNLNLTDEEKEDIESLENRLRLYKEFCTLSLHIKNNFGKNISFLPEERKNFKVVFMPDKQINKENMLSIIEDIYNKIPKKVFMPKVEIKKVITIQEMIDKLKERIESSLQISFRDFAGKVSSKEEKVNLIIGFLAMLELVRNGILNVIQENNFEDITIEKQI